MYCCHDILNAMEREMILKADVYQLRDGRIFNDIDTEFFIRQERMEGDVVYLGINYCPFCGRAISRGLWAAEKKK